MKLNPDYVVPPIIASFKAPENKYIRFQPWCVEIRKDIGPLVNKTHQVLNTTPGCTFRITSHLCQKYWCPIFHDNSPAPPRGECFHLWTLASCSHPARSPTANQSLCYPVLCVTVVTVWHCHRLDHLSIFHLSNPLPLPWVREASSLPSTVGCCIPSGDPGHLVSGHLWFSCSVKKIFNDTGRWEVVGSSMSCQCLRKFVSSLGDQPESVKKAANWASVIRWRSVYKSGT